jgi:hypothetical protein
MSILKKAIRGASSAGAQFSLEQIKEDMLQKREERLQSFQRELRAEDQDIRRTERAEDRLASEQSELRGISERAQGRIQDQANSDRSFELQKDQFGLQERDSERADQALDMDRDRLELMAQQIGQQLEAGNLGLIETRRLQGIQDIIVNPDSDADEISTAVQMLNNLKGGSPDRYEFIKLAGEFGEGDQVMRANRRDGSANLINLNSDNIMPDMPNPAQHRGRVIEDTNSGVRYRSNGSEWVPES